MNENFTVDLNDHIKKKFRNFIIIFIISLLGVLVIWSLFLDTNNTIQLILRIIILAIIMYIVSEIFFVYRRMPNFKCYKIADNRISYIIQAEEHTINKIDALLKTSYPELPDEIRKKYAYMIRKLLKG